LFDALAGVLEPAGPEQDGTHHPLTTHLRWNGPLGDLDEGGPVVNRPGSVDRRIPRPEK